MADGDITPPRPILRRPVPALTASTPDPSAVGAYQFTAGFQAHLLAVALQSPDLVMRYRTALDPAYFGSPEHREIAVCLFAFIDKNRCLPHQETLLQLLDQAPGQTSREARRDVALALYADHVRDADAVMALAIDFGRQRALANWILSAAERIQRNETEGLFDGMQKAMLVGHDLLDVGVNYKDLERLAWYRRVDDPGQMIPTGIYHLDHALNGGIRRGELALIQAPPKRGKCVDPDTLVWTVERGYIRIGDLAGTPLHVVGVTPTLDDTAMASMVDFVSDTVKPIYEIHLRSGRILRGFASTHPVLTMTGWKETKDLAPGDFVLSPKRLPLTGRATLAQRRLAWLHGVVCGNGAIGETSKAPTLHMHVTDHDEVVDQVDRWFPGLIRSDYNYKGMARTLPMAPSYYTLCEEWGISRSKAKDKRIPPRVWRLGPETVAAFVAGLFDTDGSAWLDRGRPTVEWSTASYGLATDLLAALHVLGIYASIRHKDAKCAGKVFDAWMVTIRDGDGIALLGDVCAPYGAHARKWAMVRQAKTARGQYCHRVPAPVWEWALESCQASGRTLSELYGTAMGHTEPDRKGSEMIRRSIARRTRVNPEAVARMAAYLPEDQRIARHAGGAFAYDEIESIRVVKEGLTVDIEVADVHSFVAEGVITHNTSSLINIVFGALSNLHGYRVAHYSLELDKYDVIARYDSRLLGDKAILRYTDMDAYLVELEAALPSVVGDLHLQQYFTRTASIETIRAHLAVLGAQGFSPDLVVVDYADIMKPVRRLGEHRHEQAGIYEDLRQLAGDFKCGVWTASQSNRASLEEEVLDLSHIAESLEKAAIADMVISFCQSRTEAAHGLCRLHGTGMRRCEDGFTVECTINRKQCRIESTALINGAMENVPLPGSSLAERGKSAVRTITRRQRQESAATPTARQSKGAPPLRALRAGVHP